MRLASIAVIAISASALTSAQSPKLTREAEDTTLVNDEKYWVIDSNTIEVRKGDGSGQAFRYVRCPRREVP